MRSDRILCLQEKPAPAGEVCCYHQNTLHQLRLAQGRQAGSHLEADGFLLRILEKRDTAGGLPSNCVAAARFEEHNLGPLSLSETQRVHNCYGCDPPPPVWSLPQTPFSIQHPLPSAHLGRFATTSPHPVLLLPLSPLMIHNI